MRLALALLVLVLQDDVLKKQLEALRSDDVVERDRALSELKKTPLDKLPLLEPSLESGDADLRTRVREAMTEALRASLGKHTDRFVAKAVAPRSVIDQWDDDGRSAAKVPKGYERIKYPASLKRRAGYEYLEGEELLVETAAILTNEDVATTEVCQELMPGGTRWVTRFELTPDGAKRFDAAAARLDAQLPSGLLAMVVDGAIISMPAVLSPSFGGHGQISGAANREEAERTAGLLKGKWVQMSFRVTVPSGSSARIEDAMAYLKNLPALKGAECSKSGESECSLRGPIDTRQVDLVALWKDLRRKGFVLIQAK